MKRVFCFFLSMLTVCFSMSAFSFTSYAEEDTEDLLNVLEYEVLEDDTIKITRFDSADATYVIPDKIEEKTVTVIGKKAFSGCHIL
ncbi:MAG: hypothetical protein IKB73_07270, partial [Ruminococcus sp.]|nr:hypothetical protein [Ruminococcus sp.]